MTAEETYKAVLSELRKNNTATMTPAQFNYHSWVGMIEYIKTRYYLFDQHQKAIDDLQRLIVTTDGQLGSPDPLDNLGGSVSGAEAFALPVAATPPYMFLLQAQFMLTYMGDDCHADGTLSSFIPGYSKPYNENNLNVYDQSQVNDRIHFRIRNDYIRPLAGQYNGYAVKAEISYLRYPVRMSVNETTGLSEVNPELDDRVMLEVVKWITHSFLETIESLRTKSLEAIQSKVFTHQKNN